MSHPKVTVGAPWWRDALLAVKRPLGRHTGFLLLGGAALGTGCLSDAFERDQEHQAQLEDEQDVRMGSLELQRQEGWNVGRYEAQVTVTDALSSDVEGTQRWQAVLEYLPQVYAPSSAALTPWFVPTLLQSLQGPPGASLRQAMKPTLSPQMTRAWQRGRALFTLMEQAGYPRDTAIVIDLPGPQSLAVAAALVEHYDPVLTFDNWPHPSGVVPSQQTLAAALYYAPTFERARATRASDAPPVFVLDSARLTPVTDEEEQFDNRYLARLPQASALAQLGVHHVLYVTSDGSQAAELDDLNEDFVAWQETGIDVKMIAMSDFVESVEPPPPEVAADMHWPFSIGGSYWYYGGDPRMHVCFWEYYGWHQPLHPVRVAAPAAVRVARGFTFSPTTRATVFSATTHQFGVASHPLPMHLGSVSVRTSRATGGIVGMHGGGTHSGYSTGGSSSSGGHFGGSFGRAGGSFGGG